MIIETDLDNILVQRESQEPVFIPWSAPEGTDPTALTVQLAFVPVGERPDGEWQPATWETIDGVPYATATIGIGALDLAPDTYAIFSMAGTVVKLAPNLLIVR
jgi:hypothetical protein